MNPSVHSAVTLICYAFWCQHIFGYTVHNVTHAVQLRLIFNNPIKLNTTASGYASYLLYTTPLLLGVSWTKQSDRALNCRGRLLVLGITAQ